MAGSVLGCQLWGGGGEPPSASRSGREHRAGPRELQPPIDLMDLPICF